LSQNPSLPEHLRPLAQGYTPRQTQLDAEMVALHRPTGSMRTMLNPEACRQLAEAIETWEYANPEAAARWLELRAQQRAEEAKLYEERFGPEAFAREQMRVAGFEEPLIGKAMRELHDSACFSQARDWLRDGTTWSLVLTGPPGCGKSQAATWAAFQLFTRNRFSPRCARCPKVSEESHYGGEAEEYRWRCATAGVLLLDDLGEGEQCNEKRHVWRAWVDDVLTQRYAERRKTIITTNRLTTELRQWLGERLIDRLNEGVVVSTNDPSLRGSQPVSEPGSEG
jgi:DNA replication protein DnaC